MPPELEPPAPMPVEPLVLPAPVAPLLGAPIVPVLLLLGEAVEPLADEPLDDGEPIEDEPLAAPCSRRQRSFSEPVMVSHCVAPPRAGEVVEDEPVALGEELEEPNEPLAEEPVLPDPPTLCDDDWAMATAENASNAVTAAAEKTFSICFSYMK